VTIETSAPTRIDLAGGTIDIWPLYLFHPGAPDSERGDQPPARARLESRADTASSFESEDTGATVEADDWKELWNRKELRLLSLLVHFFEDARHHVDDLVAVAAGAGIAGSSALNVAVCAALADWKHTHFEPEALLQVAMNVEAQDDRRAHRTPGLSPRVVRRRRCARARGGWHPPRADVGGFGELESRIVLCYTGEPRNSGTNNWEITKKHIDGDTHIFDCFERIRDTAAAMRDRLQHGDWDGVGAAIAEEWNNRKRLAPGVTTPAIDALIARATRRGATAAKVCGAGGGGCLFCYGPPARRAAIAEALAAGGARLLDFTIERDGLTRG
jgi:D-glycero-alpha-D-manno-heptose-7-phosphate kinase